MSTEPKFAIEQVMNGQNRTLLFSGELDEMSRFDTIQDLQGTLVINFREVTSINSFGVRNWANFMATLAGRQVIYEECPPHIVRQLNRIPSFQAHARVESVFIRYICEKCQAEKMSLVSRKAFESKEQIPETMPCEICKEGEMEFDGQLDQYFSFGDLQAT